MHCRQLRWAVPSRALSMSNSQQSSATTVHWHNPRTFTNAVSILKTEWLCLGGAEGRL